MVQKLKSKTSKKHMRRTFAIGEKVKVISNINTVSRVTFVF